MKVYENECCDCATYGYPCIGNACSQLKVLHIICDDCGDEMDDMYEYNGSHYCTDCLVANLLKGKIIKIAEE